MKSIFINGQSSTVGQQIHSLLSTNNNISLITISDPENITEQYDAINSSDLTILCSNRTPLKTTTSILCPSNKDTRILDCSGAFQTATKWVYGFPELSLEQSFKITSSQFVRNPNYYTSGAIAALYPLMHNQNTFHYRGEVYVGLDPTSSFCPTIIGLSGRYSHEELNYIQDITVQTGVKSCSFQSITTSLFTGVKTIIPIDLSKLFQTNLDKIKGILGDHYGSILDGNVYLSETKLSSDLSNDDNFGGLDDKLCLKICGHPSDSQITIVSMVKNPKIIAAKQALQNVKLMLDLS